MILYNFHNEKTHYLIIKHYVSILLQAANTLLFVTVVSLGFTRGAIYNINNIGAHSGVPNITQLVICEDLCVCRVK